MRIGIGYDIHKLVSGRPLILGGVEIPHAKGLMGHSDADSVLHALCDAVLGALGLGDIGEHFPDTQKKYKGIASSRLLEKAADMVKEKKYTVNNIDVTVIIERPKISPFKNKMKENIARILGIDKGHVNVKATTSEGIGAVGRSEGIAAIAIATLVPS